MHRLLSFTFVCRVQRMLMQRQQKKRKMQIRTGGAIIPVTTSFITGCLSTLWLLLCLFLQGPADADATAAEEQEKQMRLALLSGLRFTVPAYAALRAAFLCAGCCGC
jgi:hypothetical protein